MKDALSDTVRSTFLFSFDYASSHRNPPSFTSCPPPAACPWISSSQTIGPGSEVPRRYAYRPVRRRHVRAAAECRDAPRAHAPLCVPRDTALRVLADCPRLTLLSIQWHVSEAEEDAAGYYTAVTAYTAACFPCVYDVRFVIGRFALFWGVWVTGARGGCDAWANADRFVARKRQGEIEVLRQISFSYISLL
ncbi:hypothetical protein DFH06DRAFT_1423592 [Mycena polygramma]|nr:hypothetical protein DFH06DRAFT_1423592 [Mycena polygramma]